MQDKVLYRDKNNQWTITVLHFLAEYIGSAHKVLDLLIYLYTRKYKGCSQWDENVRPTWFAYQTRFHLVRLPKAPQWLIPEEKITYLDGQEDDHEVAPSPNL